MRIRGANDMMRAGASGTAGQVHSSTVLFAGLQLLTFRLSLIPYIATR
jgi:hypothetical protein